MKTAIIISLGDLEPLLQLYISETGAKLDEQLTLSKFLIWMQQQVKKEKLNEQNETQDKGYAYRT